MCHIHKRYFCSTFHYWLLISTDVGVFISIVRSVNGQLWDLKNNFYSFVFCSILLKADTAHPSSSKELGRRQVQITFQITKEFPLVQATGNR